MVAVSSNCLFVDRDYRTTNELKEDERAGARPSDAARVKPNVVIKSDFCSKVEGPY